MECIVEESGSNLKQYGKSDCTFTDAIPVYGDLYAPYAQINLPQGITFGDIVLMRIHQSSSAFSGANDQYIFKKSATTVVTAANQNTTNTTDASLTATSIILPIQTQSGTAESVTEVTIVATK